jgi:hypothetical protein
VCDAWRWPKPNRGYHPRLVNLRARQQLLISAVVTSPLVLAAVLLTQRPWAPVLDMAMTELRVRDVGGSHTPLIGLPGRIGNFPDQGSHPGPASFYLLAPVYRLAGGTAYGLELGSIVINSVVIGLIVWIGRRLDRTRGMLVMAAVVAVAIRGYGMTVLTHPWNPYFPVLIWILVLVAAWAALAGDHSMAVIVAVAGSVAAQTHVPYLLNALAVNALVLGVLVARVARVRPIVSAPALRSLLVTVAAGALMWLPALIDQLIRDPGNVRMLVRHFASDPPEPAIGTGTGVELFFRHLDAVSAFADLFVHGDSFVHRSGLRGGSGVLGALVFVLWIAAAVFAVRRRERRLMALHAVLAAALAAGGLSMLRIFGKVWYYLTLWAWGTMLMVVVSLVWTALVLVRERNQIVAARDRAMVAGLAVLAVALCTPMSIAAAVAHDVPEHQLSDGLRAVVPVTAAALDAGVGPAVGHDGRYLVFWQDAVFIGAQGYGLVNELERRGFDVGVHRTWRVPVTPQRVFTDGTYDAEVHLVSGEYIDEWRLRPGFVEVIEFDVRTAHERERFDALHARVERRLGEVGRSELMETVDRNLFGASLDPELPGDIVDDLSEMLLLAEPVAIFIAPPGSSM